MKLSSARVLLTNDDGVRAKGLDVLLKSIQPLVREVWIVAPEREQSASSHSLTLRRPLRIRKLSNKRYSVDGTPTDCVLLAISEVMRQTPPDLIISGINCGGNLGGDLTYSGTVAAAMEGTLHGIFSIAFSQVYSVPNQIYWGTAAGWTEPVLDFLKERNWPDGILMNVNFPSVKCDSVQGIEVVSQGQRKIGDEVQRGLDPRGDPYFWIGSQRTESKITKGTDLDAISNGSVAITPLSLEFTHLPTLIAMKEKKE